MIAGHLAGHEGLFPSTLSPCHLVTLSPCHLFASLSGSAGSFLLPAVVVYLAWVWLCRLADRDAAEVGLPARAWNLLLLGSGLLGLLVAGAVPAAGLPLAFLALLLLCFGPALGYVCARDRKVAPADRLLGAARLRRLLGRPPARRPAAEAERRLPVRFLGADGQEEGEDRSRAARAGDARGYRAARRLVHQAVRSRAGDVRLEPARDGVAVRFRVDGILRAAEPLSRSAGEAVISVLKVLAGLNVAEKRKPQDGAFAARVEDRTLDLRVATAGNVAGERLVLRLRDRADRLAELGRLGMAEPLRRQLRELIARPQGLILVSGPAGSGRSTAVSACLNEIDRFQKHVLDLDTGRDDPVANVARVRVAPTPGQTFAGELRALLRQAADVLALGDFEERATAEALCEAARTGHLVFATPAAGDAVAALTDLVGLGVPPETLAAAVSGVLCQRLVRVLCPDCRVRYRPDPETLRRANLPAGVKHFYRPPDGTGSCASCGGTGYHGRTGIFELLVMTDGVRDLLRDPPNFNAVRQAAIRGGMRPLQEDGLRQVIDGATSIQELLRVSK
jgi:type II secretory ATPase GspE/PulE/Tfp pilus assembly ATPase PilB-like protein